MGGWWLGWLACAGDPVADGQGEGLAASVRRDAERRMVHGTEVVLLWRTAQDALDEDRWEAAAAAVALGIEVDRDRFVPLVEAVAASDDPAALAILAARVDRERFQARADRSAVDRRYTGPALAVTLGGYREVDRRRGERVLRAVDAEYVVEPDAERMSAAVAARFRALADSPPVRAAFPGWTGLGGPGFPLLGAGPPAGEDVVARIDRAVAAGLPAEVAVAEGVSAALGALDPYTRPVWPAALAGWEEHHAGSYVGVGVDLIDGALETPGVAPGVYVGLPVVGGPAWAAGVHAGDRIVAVQGEAADRLDSAAVSALLRGEAGSTVTLDVARGEALPSFTLTRTAIREETVTAWRRTAAGWDPWVAPGVALLRVSAFRPHTDEELDAIALDPPPEAVVLDLRGNGGGDVMAAVNVADRFVDHGDLAHLEGRTLSAPVGGPNGEVAWNVALPGHPLEGLPVVILVDRDTASAAELVAGALRELAPEARLVGEATYGKGLSQALRVDNELGVGWQVTDGTWLLPSRRALEAPGGARTGLEPDVALPLSPAERLQVRAMQRQRELPPVHPDGTPVPDLGAVARAELPRLSDDPQLAAALAEVRRLLGP